MFIEKAHCTAEILKYEFEPGFWTDVLYAWCELTYKKEVDGNQCFNQFLWLNSHIKVKNKCFVFKEPYKNGLKYVNQLVKAEGGLMPARVVCQLFDMDVMKYNNIVSAIPKNWLKTMKNCQPPVDRPKNTYEIFKDKPKLTSYYYKKMNVSDENLKRTYKLWEKKRAISLEYDDFCELFENIYLITTNTKLRSFQYRLLNNAIF